MWYVASQQIGTSALGLQHVLGLGSYETAWTWLHKLRRAMVRPGRERLTGPVEVDETYLGAEEAGIRGRGALTKALIVVAAEHAGRGHVVDEPLKALGRRIRHVAQSDALRRWNGMLIRFAAST